MRALIQWSRVAFIEGFLGKNEVGRGVPEGLSEWGVPYLLWLVSYRFLLYPSAAPGLLWSKPVIDRGLVNLG